MQSLKTIQTTLRKILPRSQQQHHHRAQQVNPAKRYSYRKSRCVKLVYVKSSDDVKKRNNKNIIFSSPSNESPKQYLSIGKKSARGPARPKPKCPAPPHNTTSFLMNYHQEEVRSGSDSILDFLNETAGVRLCISGTFLSKEAGFSYDDPIFIPQ